MVALPLIFDDEPMDYAGLRTSLLAVKAELLKKKPELKGGAGSGNYGHEGRPGERGGSAPGSASSERAIRATRSHVPMTKERRAAATSSEKQVAFLVGGEASDDNKPFDVIAGKNGIETKTILPGARSVKITMHPDSLARKLDEAKKSGLQPHTIVIDKRGSTPQYYYKKGVGSYRLNSMTKVAAKDLRGLIRG
jgi:hypothetical protein